MTSLTPRTAGSVMAVTLTLIATLIALLCLTVLTDVNGAAAQSRYEPPRSERPSSQSLEPLSASQRAVLSRYAKKLVGKPARPPRQSTAGSYAAVPGTAEDSHFCCWYDSKGDPHCHPVDLLTICINSFKVSCDDNGDCQLD